MKPIVLSSLLIAFSFYQSVSAEQKSEIVIKKTFQKCKTDNDCAIVPINCSHSATGCKSINKKYLHQVGKPACSNYKGEVGNYECMDDAALCVSEMCRKYESFGDLLDPNECDRIKALHPGSNVLRRCKTD